MASAEPRPVAPMPAAAPGNPSAGLSSQEAAARLAQYGPNSVAEAKPHPLYRLAARFWAPIPWMLEAAIAVQLALGETFEAAVVGGLLVFNGLLAFFQENRSGAAIAALRKHLAIAATVRRDGIWKTVPAEELVPGDVTELQLGMIVPADLRLDAGSLAVDQSTLTGESALVRRGPGAVVYAGALIRNGAATGEVIATGSHTYFGKTVELVKVAGARSREEMSVVAVVRNLAVFNGGVAIGVIAYGHLAGMSLEAVASLALTVLLAAIPVALPAAFTLAAALGALAASRRGVLLARLTAIHDAASMDLLCSDKTGTLTLNETRIGEVQPVPPFSPADVLGYAALATAEESRDPVDLACLAAAAQAGVAPEWRVTAFTPFDPATKMSRSEAVRHDGRPVRAAKGAPAAIAALAQAAEAAWRIPAAALAAQGNRVLAVAVAQDDGPFRLAGLLALSDPPRPDSAALVAELRDLGIRTVMVTGDGPATAQAIGARVRIEGALCPPEALAAHAPPTGFGIYAGVFPEDKFRLVRAFQRAGHVVGMCGDGVNDAPALRQAQVGIAVASATDAAKSAAAIVLTNPGLGDIVAAVRESRRIYQRIRAYTLNTLIRKFEFGPIVALALPLAGQAVMTPLLMVLLLLAQDFLTMALVADRAGFSQKPETWRPLRLSLAAGGLALCELVFTLAVILAGQRFFALSPDALRSLTFITMGFGSQATVYLGRESGRMWASRPSWLLVVASAGDIAAMSLLAFTGTLMAPLSAAMLAAVAAAWTAFAVCLDFLKVPLFRRLEFGAAPVPGAPDPRLAGNRLVRGSE
jgi:H+-transporting ATPase